MSLALLIAGVFAVVAGLLAIAFGFSVREFSLGSTLIISGTVGVCSGLLLTGLHLVLLELKGIGRRLAGAAAPSEVRVRPVLPGLATPPASEATPAPILPEPAAAAVAAAPPWQAEAVGRERPRVEATPEPAAPEPPRRRNLLFESSSRRERERAEAKTGEPSPEAPAAATASEPAPASFDDAWPKPDRARPPEPPAAPRRPPPRTPSTLAPSTVAPPPLTEAAPAPPAEPPSPAGPPPVTVLKSGIVDGMAYSLYSDGSIEAQMPEGMMRFASIDELRTHLDQRGG